MDKNKLVAQRIMNIREEKGISQKDFSLIIDMSKSTFCDKENGKTEITVNELFRFAQGLNVSVSRLLGIEESATLNNSNGIVITQSNNGTIYFQPSTEMIEKLTSSHSK